MTHFIRHIARYIRNEAGTILAAFAVMLPMMVSAVGTSMDLSQAYLVRQRLGGALDSAALAATASATDPDDIEARVEEFFEANYPDEKIGLAYDLVVTIDGDEVLVSAYADFETSFMKVAGIDEITVYKETVVQREVKGLEVVLVLDNSGSMGSSGRMDALKEASENFIEILFDRADEPEDVKIGLVTYSSGVNVGPYGIGETPDGDTYGDGEPFVDLPVGMSYTSNCGSRSASEWCGCVVAYNEDGWDEDSSRNDPYPSDITDVVDGPWEIFQRRTWRCRGSGSSRTCSYEVSYPNSGCPRQHAVPLTSDEDELLDAVDYMTASGNTLGNYGMTWGYRMLSPFEPFTEGADYDDPMWQKAIVMMTDGQNYISSSTYSSYWIAGRHQIRTDDLNDRLEDVCERIKDDGITIYTITFGSGVDSETKGYYERCATTEDQYHDAPSQAALIDVFEAISRELANLHITR